MLQQCSCNNSPWSILRQLPLAALIITQLPHCLRSLWLHSLPNTSPLSNPYPPAFLLISSWTELLSKGLEKPQEAGVEWQYYVWWKVGGQLIRCISGHISPNHIFVIAGTYVAPSLYVALSLMFSFCGRSLSILWPEIEYPVTWNISLRKANQKYISIVYHDFGIK